MRALALLFVIPSLMAGPALAQRHNSSPLVKAAPTVAPCLQGCEAQFAVCETRPQATTQICPESRVACIVRCDPAVASSDTLKALRRSAEDLRYRPLAPQTPLEQCRQGCQDRRALCQGQNDTVACDPATSACYARCEASDKTPVGKARAP